MQVGVRANKNFETKWARHGKFIADPDRSKPWNPGSPKRNMQA